MSKLKEKTIVTIGRSFGSRGRAIGKKLAEDLGIPYYDKEILEITAKKSGMCTNFVESYDEKPTKSLMYSIAMGTGIDVVTGMSLNETISSAQRTVICEIAAKEPCVIVGRRADKVLQDDYDVVSIFISARHEDRVKHVCEREGVSESEAAKRIKKADRERASYYNYFGDAEWGKADNYSLCISSSGLTPEQGAKIIENYLVETGRM